MTIVPAPVLGLPAYNGGLFSPNAAPLLEATRLADTKIAPIIYHLSHVEGVGGERRFVNYREMSVQQLGSIYERLLEREPVRGDDGEITIRLNPYARKDSGSFFTPQELVDLIGFARVWWTGWLSCPCHPLKACWCLVAEGRVATLPIVEHLDEL
ncbi:MAG: hypothetical protein OXE53_11770, partial [Deltaproteobacteria bacterium]|nr:hypothetical protein [Deltaproteobacteria bacterium]